MKAFIRIVTLVGFAFLLSGQLKAQCEISNLAIELKSTVTIPGNGCRVIFNFSWDQQVNNGNKHMFIHLWNTSQYPDLLGSGNAYVPTSNHPDPDDLSAVLATIVIDNSGSDPVVATSYYPHPTVPVLSEGLNVSMKHVNPQVERVTIENINLIVPNCNGAGITGDIWSSQATYGNVHCLNTNVSVVVGNPVIAGLLYCTVPRQYNISIENAGLGTIITRYNILVDDGDGIYEPGSDTKTNTTAFGPDTLTPGETIQSGMHTYLPYAATKPYADRGLWVEVITEGFPNKTVYFLNNFCIGLPVSFISFTARRQGDMVILTWETATESNNSGFDIERKIGEGNWEVIDFVVSKAPAGNSDIKLAYVYTDDNPVSRLTEYRIKQIDIDRQASYSKVNAVKGIGYRAGILIYPNPSRSGQVQIVLDDMNSHSIYIYDGDGRMIREWNNYTDNNLTVNGLYPGYYLLKVADRVTGRIENKKFIIMH